MSKALIDSGFIGKIDTEILFLIKKIFWNSISDIEGKKNRIELLMNWQNEVKNINFIEGITSKVLKNFPDKKINFAFLDAQHDMESVLDEYNFLKDRQQKEDIIIFDDVSSNFNEIRRAIEKIKLEGEYKINLIEFENENRGYAIATKF